MTDKPIRVFFNMLDKNGDVIDGLHTEITYINLSQATQIVNALTSVPYPMRKRGLCKMSATLSSDGKKLNINRTFDAETLDDEDYIFMHCTGAWCNCPETIHKKCAKNLCNGKCKNQYMRETVGAILFPELYKRYNQKQK